MSGGHKRTETEQMKGYSSEELYRILFEQATDGIFISDAMGNYIEVNPRGCEMLGYSREELLGLSISDLILPEDLQEDPLHFEELRTGKMTLTERRLRCKDGTMVHVEISGNMLSDGMILGLVRDTSQRKLSEESLRQAEKKYRNIFEHSLDGIFQSTPEGRFITVNPSLAHMWGYHSPEDLLNRINNIALQIYVNPEERNEFLRAMEKDEEVHGFEFQSYRKDGSVLWVQESVRTVRNTNGEVLYYEGTVRDISEVKQAEEFLRRSEERYRRTLNNMLEGCQIIDYDWRYIYVNDTAAQQGRLKPEEMLMRSMPELYPGIEKTKMFAALQYCMENRTPHRMENQFTYPDGDTGWFELSIEPVPEGLFILSVDITERKQAEAALKESEKSLKEAQRVGHLGSWDWNADHDVTTWSEEYYRICGMDPNQQAPGYEKHLKTFTPESAAKLDAAVQNALQTGEPYELDLELVRADGTSIWITARGEVERNSNGRITGLRGIAQDITERKQAEKEVRERELRYRTLFENLPIPVYTKDLEGRYTSFNHEEAKYWEESPIGHTDPELLPPEIADALRKHDLQVIETGKPWFGEEEFHAPDGLHHTLGRKIPLYDDAGNVVGILGASVDITDRKRAEQELQEREIRYRTLFENLPIPVFTKDRDGRYTSCNAEQLKYWEQNPIGHTDHELLPVEIADAFRRVDLAVMETGKPFYGEEKILAPSGYHCSLVRKVPLYDVDGNLIGTQGAGIDITERKQAEKRVREAKQFAQLTIDALTAHICVLDETGVILSVNQAWREFAEANPPVPPNHFVGDNYLTVCDVAQGEDSSEAAIFASGLRAVLQNERDQFSLEYPCNVPGGEKRWFIARITRFSIGDATRVVVAHENISIRKMAEEALRESEVRFSTVFHSSPLSIALTRLRDDKLVAVNKAWLESTEYSLQEAIKYSPQELKIWAVNEHRDEFVKQLKNLGRQQGVELQLCKKSGETSDVLLSAELIELSGEPHMLSMALDISDRKRSEKKIKQQLDRLTALSEIDRMIASSFDLSLTLSQLIRQVIRQLEVDAAAVLLTNPFTNMLEYVAGDGFHTSAITYLKLRAGEGYAGKAALERSMVHLPQLATADPPFTRTYRIEDEKFVSYFGLPLIAKGQLKGILEVFLRKPLDPDEEWLSFLEMLAEQAAIAIDNAELFNHLQQKNAELTLAYDATIEGWSYALDLRDKETEGHTRRVTDMTFKLGKKFGLKDNELRYVRWGALLHDIGKMGVPDAILQKPDKLDDEEWEIMKMHPIFARNMLERINYLKSAIDIPYCHHERWDGTGYPRGLKGEQIPLAARIFAIADVWDALTSDRPYRPAWPKSKVLDHVRNASGTHFDPQVVKLFLESEELWHTPND